MKRLPMRQVVAARKWLCGQRAKSETDNVRLCLR